MVSSLTVSPTASHGKISLALALSMFLFICVTAKGHGPAGNEKLKLTASVNGSRVQLQWSLAENLKLSHFVIQRSVNGRDYSDAAMVMPDAASPDHIFTYNEIYGAQKAKVIYFRLKMVNADGIATFSNVRTIRLNTTVSRRTLIRPNPIASELRINDAAAKEYLIRLTTGTNKNEAYAKR